ncbi:class A beta-lactamase [Nocardia sp. X0981]
MSRRRLLVAAAAAPLFTACASSGDTTPAAPTGARHVPLEELEKTYGARLGIYAHTMGRAPVEHRADERFAFCSTFKTIAAAAVLQRTTIPDLDTVRITITPADLMKSSVITSKHLASGMTLRQLCDAAIRYSDGTAGNLLLRRIGGPAALTAFTRTLGDDVTRMDRAEPDIVSAVPGDLRDTSTPRALGRTYETLVLGDTLPPGKREILVDLLRGNKAGAGRIRAGVPAGWTVGNRTGTGDYGTLNDIAVLWPPDPARAPLLLAIMSSKPVPDAPYTEELIAEAARYCLESLT